MKNWIPDYNSGFEEVKLDDHVVYNKNKYWINSVTKERITDEEFRERFLKTEDKLEILEHR